MKRLERLEKHGWKVSVHMGGTGATASKNNGLRKIQGSSITNLHFIIFGW